ncbi:hypothetical protein ACFQHO_23115 [Actinomadura yumaensis]|uniref:hypothetical protein n=1 Tax=Actinomadura TaxID=1988 RepID=UPI00132456F1|nr:hypothetical protein [Actinomadura sp. J1-007]MWK35016.1 hypothetical protein [Actinomadura sp. J1-007]
MASVDHSAETSKPGESGEALRDAASAAYEPLIAAYEAFEERLRGTPEDIPPVGWEPQLAALRAFLSGDVPGEWEDLARLLVDPESLVGEKGTRVRLIEVPEDAAEAAAVRRVVERLLSAGERALLLAPTRERAEEIVRDVAAPDSFTLVVESLPYAATSPEESEEPVAAPVHGAFPVEAGQDDTLVDPVEDASAGVTESGGRAPGPPSEDAAESSAESPEGPRETFGANGTVEFKPVRPAQAEPTPPPVTPVSGTPLPDSGITRAEPIPPSDVEATRAEPIPQLPLPEPASATRAQPIVSMEDVPPTAAEEAEGLTRAEGTPVQPEPVTPSDEAPAAVTRAVPVLPDSADGVEGASPPTAQRPLRRRPFSGFRWRMPER